MNRARVAALFRELAEAIEEDDDVPRDAPSRPRSKKAERPRRLTRPAGEAPSVLAAQAARILKDKGFT